ncbi:MAG: alpha/beta hydrolase [Bacteroidales bacterium]|nr:alpha/beta hydrolase [Bacteroidales bacterium]
MQHNYHKWIVTICCLWICSIVCFGQSAWARQPRRLTAYPAGRTAIVVCPGGSYSWLDKKTEGHEVARWLQSQGISAYVLCYRVQGGFAFGSGYRHLIRGHQYPDPQRDLQQTIEWLRQNADSLGIDPHRIGAMGFSAGGHLVTSAGALFDAAVRPDFVVAVYPVVTFRQAPYVHRRSRRALLGEWRRWSQQWRDSLSLEIHVPDDMPPTLVVNCQDDPIVHYHNSELLDSALTARHIDHKYLQYRTGGHGFGVDSLKAGPEAIAWKQELLNWLQHEQF